MFLPIDITTGGYIKAYGERGYEHTVHRESRQLQERYACLNTLELAKQRMREQNLPAILELSADGGGKAVWMTDARKPELTARLRLWAGCYGLWPIRRLNDEGGDNHGRHL